MSTTISYCSTTSSTLHTAFVTDEESSSPLRPRLGHITTTIPRLPQGIEMVDDQFTTMEWQEHFTTNASTDDICRRQQLWLEMQLGTTESSSSNGIRALEPPQIINVDQLEGARGSFSCTQNLSSPHQHEDFNSDRQHDVHELHQQAGWNPLSPTDAVGHSATEMVSTSGDHDTIPTCTGYSQSNSGFRVTAPLSKKSLGDSPQGLLQNSTPLRRKRHGSLRGSQHQTIKKLRLLAPRSGQSAGRRVYDSMVPVPVSISEPIVEPNQLLSPQNHPGETSTGHNDHTLVAQRPMVPDIAESQLPTTSSPRSDFHSAAFSSGSLVHDQRQVEAIRVAALGSRYRFSALNPNARSILLRDRLNATSSTNRSYKRGQTLFLKWAHDNQISTSNFTPEDLVNFLDDMSTYHSYAVSTIQPFRSGITHLHQDPNRLRLNDTVNEFITSLLRAAPPVRQHLPTISL
ncbi:hypothetical protein G6F43_012147 [Rhizopus delemar]|nr:hypothetical protein G6F43_012147 [Rhizopus delemar]